MKLFLIKRKTFMIITIAILLTVGIITALMFCYRITLERKLLYKYDLVGLTVQEKVTRLDEITFENSKLRATISPTKLTISENNINIEYRVPKDLFYLSIAPYLNDTHPCAIHSLSGCRSELNNSTFFIEVFNSDQTTLISEERVSMENGFIGLWLPRGIEGKIVISYGELQVEAEFTTYNNSITCLTSPLKLE